VIGVARLAGDGAGVVTPALVTLCLVSVAAGLVIVRWAPAARPLIRADGATSGSAGDRRIPAGAWWLGAMAFSCGLAEGTAIDWSSVHVTDVALVAPSTGALGLVAVSSLMVLVRLFGDRGVATFGRVIVVRFGGLVAAAGYLVVITAEPLPVLLGGWALVGLGVGLVAPQVYASAGHAGGGRMLAIVVTFGYGAFLVGPAIIGALIGQVGIRRAMVLPLVLSVALVALSTVLSRTVPRSDKGVERGRLL